MKTSLSTLSLAIIGALGLSTVAFAQEDTETTQTETNEFERIVFEIQLQKLSSMLWFSLRDRNHAHKEVDIT